MATQKTVEVGNATIVLTGEHDGFSDGHTTGYLEFYDERYPLTSCTVYEFMMSTITDTEQSSLWNAGRITNWMETLMENAPHTFRSVLLEERMIAVQVL